MAKYLIILTFFICSCVNSNDLEKVNYEFNDVFFDVVEKQIVFEGKLPQNLESIAKKWFSNNVKVDGLEGKMSLKLFNYQENISNINDGKRIELSLFFLVLMEKNLLSTRKEIKGEINAYSNITGDFSLKEVDALILNSQAELILLLSKKLQSIN